MVAFFKIYLFYYSELFVTDVLNNSDLFYKDLSDGISCVYYAVWNGKPLVFIGGNCAIQVKIGIFSKII